MLKIKCLLYFTFFLTITVFAQESKPKIIEVYPTTDSIPVNILRFYIHFSAPMQEMDILKHIKLTNQDGKNITGVFFENQYELWNESRTEVTLIVDPGRVKLGLLANNTMGRAFDEGKKYTLIIDSLLMDFNDRKLSESFTKTFIAVKEDMQPPDPKSWKVLLPKANTKEAIVIDFKDKIDHISAYTLIKIIKNGTEIKGDILLVNEEQKWAFNPHKNWEKGSYQIHINSSLEDIAANSVNQIFDHKTSDYNTKSKDDFILNFNIK
ncbi:MAG: hypothetical protein CVT95_08310 [Bacteroidetes bacterium HGW-Bacteroidetes-12]|nr:MAG: hypothetical protein CVT95_08310 [Bacteroidetes bacterium HGW-Bacteroidetes-12]